MIHCDEHIFQMGWNHQPDMLYQWSLGVLQKTASQMLHLWIIYAHLQGEMWNFPSHGAAGFLEPLETIDLNDM